MQPLGSEGTTARALSRRNRTSSRHNARLPGPEAHSPWRPPHPDSLVLGHQHVGHVSLGSTEVGPARQVACALRLVACSADKAEARQGGGRWARLWGSRWSVHRLPFQADTLHANRGSRCRAALPSLPLCTCGRPLLFLLLALFCKLLLAGCLQPRRLVSSVGRCLQPGRRRLSLWLLQARGARKGQ